MRFIVFSTKEFKEAKEAAPLISSLLSLAKQINTRAENNLGVESIDFILIAHSLSLSEARAGAQGRN